MIQLHMITRVWKEKGIANKNDKITQIQENKINLEIS